MPDTTVMTIDQKINNFFAPISESALNTVLYSVKVAGVDVRLLVVWLAAAAIFFTVYLGFINFKYFGHAIDVAKGKYDKKRGDGQINSYQALMASLSGTVGLGNIAGVAVAVSVGGAGATFWMIMMGVLGMSSKFAEVTLGVKYRRHEDKDNKKRLFGGPMYYLRDGLAEKGFPVLGKILGVLFAVLCLAGAIGGGNMFQANQTFQQLVNVTGGEAGFFADKGWMVGVFLAFLVGIVIIGGIKSIAAVSSRIVPLMGFVYVGAGLIVILIHAQNIPYAIGEILTSALTLKAGIGGILGGLLIGVQRAAFSNEAGLGTAAILYAAAKSDYPARQGMASMLGPFIDTVVICTVTALVIITTKSHLDGQGVEGVALTSRALASGISWFPYVLAVSVFLFAYSTLITFAYYGVRCLTFIFGQNDQLEISFKIFYCLCTVVGCAVSFGAVIDFTDAMFLSMAIPNVIGLYILAPVVKQELQRYLAKLK